MPTIARRLDDAVAWKPSDHPKFNQGPMRGPLYKIAQPKPREATGRNGRCVRQQLDALNRMKPPGCPVVLRRSRRLCAVYAAFEDDHLIYASGLTSSMGWHERNQ